MKLQESISDLLTDISNRSRILGSAVFSIEGLPFVSRFHGGIEEATIAAIVAAIHAAGDTTVRELRQGELKSIIIQGDLGTTLVISISADYLLTVTAPDNAKLGLIFNDAKKAAREARKILYQAL